ncbi:uridine diphosphate-N-acetylglucosamine-binding protein YvcK [Shewanella sp. SR44-3]|uniref:uridine diphosphate-N-acetylglucosamine-binding protein YvcK n=1 Tax=unclassified Shewanella TaxID=196818 RepID=UPI0015FA8EF7|nr:uridine diphosphate-N-acetylglucosamine-binding protein YvcK [Shewanella sp. SR44-3]MBB1267853.1 uridine diphosphate-N-acetylglucosamine-binding protein YvcK [Shewanella sp. SR44-3]
MGKHISAVTNQLDSVQHLVAIGGGHGLGRVLSALSTLGPRLTGIVATTDNGGSTGRLRQDQNTIAWGDLRNCISHLATRPSLGARLLDHRFETESELKGHNLGNLILYALDQLCVRPLEAVDLIRNMLQIDTRIIPMSEHSTHLVALSACGAKIFGELSVDDMSDAPLALMLEPQVSATFEASEAILNAEVILLGPGSFLTSIMPNLLLPELAKALRTTEAQIIFIDNLHQELSPAKHFSLADKIAWCHQAIGKDVIRQVICQGSHIELNGLYNHFPLASAQDSGRHDKQLLRQAIERLIAEENAVKLQALLRPTLTTL